MMYKLTFQLALEHIKQRGGYIRTPDGQTMMLSKENELVIIRQSTHSSEGRVEHVTPMDIDYLSEEYGVVGSRPSVHTGGTTTLY